MQSLSFHIIDLTTRLGAYTKEQLGVLGPSSSGTWLGVRSSRLPNNFVVNWQGVQSDVHLIDITKDTAGIALLIGPGSLFRLPAIRIWLAQYRGPVWYLIAPSAIVEDGQLRKTTDLKPSELIYSLPNSDPKTIWFVLMELFTKAGSAAHRASGLATGFNGEDIMAIDIKQAMQQAMAIDGAMAAALVDYRSGMCLAQAGNALNLDLAAAGNTQVVRAKLKTMESLGLRKGIEDILITLVDQYHLIRLAPNHDGLFLYLVLDKEKGNLALARYKLTDIERGLQV